MGYPAPFTFPFFTDSNGDPLDSGYIYIGTANANPQTNPVSIYWDSDLTVPASQPLRTSNGLIFRNGTPSAVYTAADYSMVVRDRNSVLIYSNLNVPNLSASGGSAQIGFLQSGADAVLRSVQSKLRDSVSITDFMTAAQIADYRAMNRALDLREAIQNAIDANSTTFSGVVVFPAPGSARIDDPISITRAITLVIEQGASIYAQGLSVGEAIIDVDGAVNPNLEFVNIIGGGLLLSNNNSPDAISLDRVAFCDIDIRITGGRYGLIVLGNRTFTHNYKVVCTGTAPSGDVIRFDDLAGGQFNILPGTSLTGGSGIGYYGSSLSIDTVNHFGVNWEACTVSGSAQSAGDIRALNYFGCRWEKNLAPMEFSPALGGTIHNIVINGGFAETDVEARAFILSGSGTITNFECTGLYAKDFTSELVQTSNGTGGLITNNTVESIPAVTSAARQSFLVYNNFTEAGVAVGDVWNQTWVDWTPTYASDSGNAATTFTGPGTVTTTIAKYMRRGKILTVNVLYEATLNAVTPTYISLTLPTGVVPQSNNVWGVPIVLNNSILEAGIVQTQTGGTIRVFRPNQAAYTSGSAISGRFTFTFEID
jgi:hypothetical protein